jgi:hypothetical protein
MQPIKTLSEESGDRRVHLCILREPSDPQRGPATKLERNNIWADMLKLGDRNPFVSSVNGRKIYGSNQM